MSRHNGFFNYYLSVVSCVMNVNIFGNLCQKLITHSKASGSCGVEKSCFRASTASVEESGLFIAEYYLYLPLGKTLKNDEIKLYRMPYIPVI